MPTKPKSGKKGRRTRDYAHRTNAYTVRYNDEENSVVIAAANRAALDVGSWIRMVSMASTRESR